MRPAMQLATGLDNPASIRPLRTRCSGVAQLASRKQVAEAPASKAKYLGDMRFISPKWSKAQGFRKQMGTNLQLCP